MLKRIMGNFQLKLPYILCFIIVSFPIDRARRNLTYETPQLSQIITPDSIF